MSPAQMSRATGLPSYSTRARSKPSQASSAANKSAANELDRAACVGAFATLPQAEHAVRQLRAVGFSKRHIAVVCCEGRSHDEDEIDVQPGNTVDAIAGSAGIVGAALGALALVVGMTSDGGTVLHAAGPASGWSAGALGGLVGAMSLFGVQPDAAERYRATVAQGSILVIVDRDDVIDDGMLVSAARILNDAGCLPLAMSAE